MFENSSLIVKIVEENGGEAKVISREREVYRLIYKGKEVLITRKFGIGLDPLSHGAFTKFKDVTTRLLEEAGVATPKTVYVCSRNEWETVAQEVKTLRTPLVVKNTSGSNSRGVFVGLNTAKEAMEVLKREIGNYGKMIVQEMVIGQEYRLLTLDGKIIGALQMVPPFVVGDGQTTTENLISAKQEHTKKQTPRDESLKQLLSGQGEALDSVPVADKKVYLRKNSCLEEGGITVDMTDRVHPGFVEVARRAAKAVRLDLGGIDILCEDISRDPGQQEYAIIEINGKPDIYIHHQPSEGQPRNVAKAILDHIITKI